MGLSQRKVKQRISGDPRNLGWADDASKFGQAYLSKFGWDPSKGLGADHTGRTSQIKVSQKLDMLGLGAARGRDPDGIAWKQNQDFEKLLKKLNQEIPVEGEKEEDEGRDTEESPRRSGMDKTVDDSEVPQQTRRGSLERKVDATIASGSKRKGKQKASEAFQNSDPPSILPPPTDLVEVSVPRPMRHRSHRARIIAAKQLSLKSATAISEILGVAAVSITIDSTTPSTPVNASDDIASVEKITTSAKTVSDYLNDKINSRSSKVAVKHDASPTQDISDWAPRAGLGANRSLSILKTQFVSSGSNIRTTESEKQIAPAVELTPSVSLDLDTKIPSSNCRPVVPNPESVTVQIRQMHSNLDEGELDSDEMIQEKRKKKKRRRDHDDDNNSREGERRKKEKKSKH